MQGASPTPTWGLFSNGEPNHGTCDERHGERGVAPRKQRHMGSPTRSILSPHSLQI